MALPFVFGMGVADQPPYGFQITCGDGLVDPGQVHGRVIGLDATADGLSRRGRLDGRGCRALVRLRLAPRALGEDRRSLRLPELDRANLLGGGLAVAVRGAERGREHGAGVGVVEQGVRRGGELDAGAGEVDRGRVLAAAGERFGMKLS